MTTDHSASDARSRSRDAQVLLPIGELAKRTGLASATLRMWESRHGFPSPVRLDSGHRRYEARDVELVGQVLRRQEAGMRLDLAIAEVTRARDLMDPAPGLPSVYAVLRQQHPTLQPHRLKKATLLALSWAIEDECCARAARPIIFGSFQKARYFRAAQDRWTELARIARSSVAFAAFEDAPEPVERTTLVHLPKEAPMRREWVVVCDAVDFPAVVTAWELPGQTGVSDRQRVFETIWTVHPRAVRDAARTCAQVALQLGTPEAASLLYELATTPDDPPTELDRVSSLLNRVVGYVDDLASPGSEGQQ